MSFGDHLRTLLEERSMTQKELAHHLNIAPSTVGSYVQNTREPDFSTLKSLAAYFHVSIDYLLDFAGKFVPCTGAGAFAHFPLPDARAADYLPGTMQGFYPDK